MEAGTDGTIPETLRGFAAPVRSAMKHEAGLQDAAAKSNVLTWLYQWRDKPLLARTLAQKSKWRELLARIHAVYRSAHEQREFLCNVFDPVAVPPFNAFYVLDSSPRFGDLNEDGTSLAAKTPKRFLDYLVPKLQDVLQLDFDAFCAAIEDGLRVAPATRDRSRTVSAADVERNRDAFVDLMEPPREPKIALMPTGEYRIQRLSSARSRINPGDLNGAQCRLYETSGTFEREAQRRATCPMLARLLGLTANPSADPLLVALMTLFDLTLGDRAPADVKSALAHKLHDLVLETADERLKMTQFWDFARTKNVAQLLVQRGFCGV